MADLRDYEIDAMEQLVLNARALAEQIPDDKHSARLKTWSRIVEEYIERVQSAGEHTQPPA